MGIVGREISSRIRPGGRRGGAAQRHDARARIARMSWMRRDEEDPSRGENPRWTRVARVDRGFDASTRVRGLTVIVARQVVYHVAQAALPALLVVIHHAVRVEHRAALVAHDGGVRKHGHLRHGLTRGAHRPEGQHHARRLDPRRRPRIPRQAHALLLLELGEVHGDRPRVTSTPRFRRTRPPRSSLGRFRPPLRVLARPGRGRK